MKTTEGKFILLGVWIAVVLLNIALSIGILTSPNPPAVSLAIALTWAPFLVVIGLLLIINLIGNIFTDKFDDRLIRVERELEDEAGIDELIPEVEELEIEEEELGIAEFEAEINDLVFMLEDVSATEILEEAGFL